jgi:hypothetical protein
MIEYLRQPGNHDAFLRFLETHPKERELARGAVLLSIIASVEEAVWREQSRILSREAIVQMVVDSYVFKITAQRDKDGHKLHALARQLSFAAIGPTLLAVELVPAPTERSAAGARRLDETLRATLNRAFDPEGTSDEPLPLIQNQTPFQLATLVIGSWFAVWVGWSMATRGGVSLRLMGIDLQTRRGQPAGRLRCGFRSFLVWLPFFTLLLVSVVMQDIHRGRDLTPKVTWLHWTPWWLAVMYLAACGLSALVRPQRGPQDRLTGVHLMPK